MPAIVDDLIIFETSGEGKSRSSIVTPAHAIGDTVILNQYSDGKLSPIIANSAVLDNKSIITQCSNNKLVPLNLATGPILSLHLDESDSTNALVDSSPYNHNVFLQGDAFIDDVVKKYGEGALKCDGLDEPSADLDYARVSSHPIFNMGSSDFMLGFWFWGIDFGSPGRSFGLFSSSNSSRYSPIMIQVANTGIGIPKLFLFMSSTGFSWDIASGYEMGNINTGQWYYCEIDKKDGVIYPFRNGDLGAGGTIEDSTPLHFEGDPIDIGANTPGNTTGTEEIWDGWVDEVFWDKKAYNTTNFDVPTGPKVP